MIGADMPRPGGLTFQAALRDGLLRPGNHASRGTPRASGPALWAPLWATPPRGERRAIPGAVWEERATTPAGLRAAARRGAAAGGHLLCCRSSTMSDIAFVAAPRICPPGARAKM